MKDDTDIVQKLLQHDEDVPVPPDHERRIREGLAHLLGGPPPPAPPPQGGGGGGGGGGAPPASPLGKWLATTAIVAGAAAGGGFLAGRSTAPVTIVSAPSAAPSTAPPPAPSPTPCAQDTTAPPKPSAAPSAKPSASATGPSAQDAFDKEQSLLERARSALVRHDVAAAEQALDECEKQFARSRHAEERDYLRIQVAREKGDVDKTRALAKTFLTKYPQSLLKTRVEQLAQ
jgi:hypothetical protein